MKAGDVVEWQGDIYTYIGRASKRVEAPESVYTYAIKEVHTLAHIGKKGTFDTLEEPTLLAVANTGMPLAFN